MPPSAQTSVSYDDLSAHVGAHGFVLRGGFNPTPGDRVPPLADGRDAETVIIVGNVGRPMWERFIADTGYPHGGNDPHPLDSWTRSVLTPIATQHRARYIHPNDEPFSPMQRWAQRADRVWPSPIGMLLHPVDGLWHAYRGAFVFASPIVDVPTPPHADPPCVTCVDQPCLNSCPVAAFTSAGYDHHRCRQHVAMGGSATFAHDCLREGCAARCACPVHPGGVYETDQMMFHMQAFVGMTDPEQLA